MQLAAASHLGIHAYRHPFCEREPLLPVQSLQRPEVHVVASQKGSKRNWYKLPRNTNLKYLDEPGVIRTFKMCPSSPGTVVVLEGVHNPVRSFHMKVQDFQITVQMSQVYDLSQPTVPLSHKKKSIVEGRQAMV